MKRQPPRLSPEQRDATIDLLESALAAVQQIDTEALPLDATVYGPRLVIGNARRSLESALRQIAAS